MTLAPDEEIQAGFPDNELTQVVKALGIRIDSLTNKMKRVSGYQKDLALAECEDCIAALDRARRELLSRMADN